MQPKFGARVANGKLEFKNQNALDAYLVKFKPSDALTVTIEKPKKPRSTAQNAWYWGAILPTIAQETGHTVEELHEIFKRMFLTRKVLKYRGREFPIPGSTTECNTTDFYEFIERVRAEASQMGISIPDPDSSF